MKPNKLAQLPQIDALLQNDTVKQHFQLLSRPVVAELARSTLNQIRRSVVHQPDEVPDFAQIVQQLNAACRTAEQDRLQKVVNASGIIIHTNMGRAPIAPEVWKAAEELNCGYSNLEFDLSTGKRGNRKGFIPRLIASLTGAEDALVVNNNAAAVFLILKTFAEGREVIVNRGEQVQIGGGFRIPEILAQSGARLAEIGTTNICTEQDYRSAFSDETAMILSVHRSNFAIRGFTSSPSIRELAGIKPEGVLLCVDQGSGVIDEQLPGETSVRSHLAGGADLVCFSGDKVLSGPQAGIIVGKKQLIEKLERHPFMRVIRPGKTVYSLLEASLIRRLNGSETMVAGSLAVDMQELKNRARMLLRGIDRQKVSVVEASFTTGGGSAPDESFPSLALRIEVDEPPEKLLATLRKASPPIIGTITADKVQLNLATIRKQEIPHIRQQLHSLLGG
ncbi:MAG: L-seryl-tRNA(Sec) selenium transferase [Spirochaetia bacterium]